MRSSALHPLRGRAEMERAPPVLRVAVRASGDGARCHPFFARRAGEHGDGARGYPAFARRAGSTETERAVTLFTRCAGARRWSALPFALQPLAGALPSVLRVAAQVRGDGVRDSLLFASPRGDGARGHPLFARRAGEHGDGARCHSLFNRLRARCHPSFASPHRCAEMECAIPCSSRRCAGARRRSARPPVLRVTAQARGDGARGYPLFARRAGEHGDGARCHPLFNRLRARCHPSFASPRGRAEMERAVTRPSPDARGARRRSERPPVLRVAAQVRGDGVRDSLLFASPRGRTETERAVTRSSPAARASTETERAAIRSSTACGRAAIRSSPAARASAETARAVPRSSTAARKWSARFPVLCVAVKTSIDGALGHPLFTRCTGARRRSARPLSSPAIRAPFRCLSSAQTRLSMPRRPLLPLRRFANLPSLRRLTRGRAMCILYG